MYVQAGRMQRAEEGADAAWSGFTRFTSAVLSLSWWGLSGSLNHSDPAHLEPMCFSILSSPVVISNQPMGLSLSPHQQPQLLSHLIPVRGTWAERHCACLLLTQEEANVI